MAGPQSTDHLIQILRPVIGPPLSLQQALLRIAGPFPIAGQASWSDDWHDFRPCPYPHLHEGVDMVAAWGTPLVAVADGRVSQKLDGPIPGLAVEITDRQGTQFFYAHLSSFATGLRVGQDVAIGDVIGYVGNTGDASHGAPHLHLEVQPGGTPVPPKPFVDAWLLTAQAHAKRLVRAATAPTPSPKNVELLNPAEPSFRFPAAAPRSRRVVAAAATRWPTVGAVALMALLSLAFAFLLAVRRRAIRSLK